MFARLRLRARLPLSDAPASARADDSDEDDARDAEKSSAPPMAVTMASPRTSVTSRPSETATADLPSLFQGLCFSSATHTVEGTRHRMEDFHVSADMGSGVALFAVIDGHGGPFCAAFIAKMLPSRVRAELNPSGRTGADVAADGDGQSHNHANFKTAWGNALTAALGACSRAWDENPNAARSSGAVLTAMLVSGLNYVIAHCGDCGAAVSTGAKEPSVELLTTPHHVSTGNEARRIEIDGGYVINGRLLGVLTPSRAFGDLDLKSRPGGQALITRADIIPGTVALDAEDGTGFLLLCTDGVWDAFSAQEAGDVVRTELARSKNPSRACRALAYAATRRSLDDITVTVVYYKRREETEQQ